MSEYVFAVRSVAKDSIIFEGETYVKVGRCGNCVHFQRDVPPTFGVCRRMRETPQTDSGFCNYWKRGQAK